ncbi:hypothetical protein CR513_00823, partial [Mucuna pruriens]
MKREKEKSEKKKKENKRKVMKKIGTEHPNRPECPKRLECPKPKNDKKKRECGRQGSVNDELLRAIFQRYSTRTTFHKGIEHQIDFTLGATLPNRATNRVEKSKEIQQQVDKLIEKD